MVHKNSIRNIEGISIYIAIMQNNGKSFCLKWEMRKENTDQIKEPKPIIFTTPQPVHRECFLQLLQWGTLRKRSHILL